MKLNGQQTVWVTWGGLGLLAIGVGYVLIKYVVPAIVKAAGDATTKAAGSTAEAAGNTLNAINKGLGSNNLTKTQTDFGGDTVDYSGHGLLSTLGAEANAVSGGTFASVGETLGGWAYDLLHSDSNPSN